MRADDDFQEAQHDVSPPKAGLQLLITTVRECQKAGLLRKAPAAMEIAIAYWASTHGLVSLYLDAGGARLYTRETYRALVGRCIQHLLAARRAS